MKKTPYLESKSHKIAKYVLSWTLIIFMLACIFGCTKQQDPVDTLAETAHQQLDAIQATLPKECQTKAIDEQIKAEHGTIYSLQNTCEMQKEKITNEKLKWKWSFFATIIIIAAYIARKVIK